MPDWQIAVAIIGIVSATLAAAVSAVFAAVKYVNAAANSIKAEESKARHDLANSFQTSIARLDIQVEQLRSSVVRKDELTSTEVRLTALFGKLDVKMDLVNDKATGIDVVKEQVRNLAEGMRRISAKIDEAPHIGGEHRNR